MVKKRTGVALNPIPKPIPQSSSPIPFSPPPPPNPELARAIAITGVIQTGNDYHAIVKVPNEATSRYIKVGQRLSNGEVLLKRIETKMGSEPIVILEQYAIEVARAVGEETINPTQTATPTNGGAVPAPPPGEETINPTQTATPTNGGAVPAPPPGEETINPAQTATPTNGGAVPAPPPGI